MVPFFFINNLFPFFFGLQADVALSALKTIEEYFGASVHTLLRLCQVAATATLPPVYQQMADHIRRKERTTMQRAINDMMNQMGLHDLQFVITGELAAKITSLMCQASRHQQPAGPLEQRREPDVRLLPRQGDMEHALWTRPGPLPPQRRRNWQIVEVVPAGLRIPVGLWHEASPGKTTSEATEAPRAPGSGNPQLGPPDNASSVHPRKDYSRAITQRCSTPGPEASKDKSAGPSKAA
jgi:hypothetical protein